MKKQDDTIWEKIALSLSNEELSDSDKKVVNDWQQADKSNKDLLDIMSSISLQSDEDAQRQKEEILNLTYTKMFALPQATTRKKGKNRFFTLGLAATFLLLLGVGGVLFVSKMNERNLVTYYCPVGEYSKRIVLPDNSEVILNSDSRLSYNKDAFTGSHRQVRLKGEALFSVTHDKKRPFTVQVSGAEIKVLGTRFNVRSYPNEEKTQATLISGSVEVRNTKNSRTVRIKPDEQATIPKDSKDIEVTQVNASDYASWQDGIFQIQSMPFQDIIRALERRYGVRIEVKTKSLNHEIFNGKFSQDETVENILSVIQIAYDFQFRKSNNGYVIY